MMEEIAETVQIRVADYSEIGAIALLIARANAQRDGEPLPTTATEEQMSDLQERMDRSHAWAYVALEDTQIAGFALGYPRTDETTPATAADTEYLSLLMIEPNSWGKGIAGRLLDTVVECAYTAGRKHVTLRTRSADNQRARGVYEHRGFILTGVTKESSYGRQVEYRLDLENRHG
jgi:GNAT superfamily N-acetyltransferase